MMIDTNVAEKISDKAEKSKRIVFLTGAGISAESGVPTFRGTDGLWRNFRAEDLATPQAFERDPKLVWEWYDMRRQNLLPLEPNKAHKAIADIEKTGYEVTLITQNVDGLHQKAGNVNCLELHGNIWNVRCIDEGKIFENMEVPLSIIPPACACGSIVRPHIVWFGESLDADIISKAASAAENSDLMFIVGTSAVVQPAASFPLLARQSRAYVVEINPELTPISGIVDISLHAKAGDAMPYIAEILQDI